MNVNCLSHRSFSPTNISKLPHILHRIHNNLARLARDPSQPASIVDVLILASQIGANIAHDQFLQARPHLGEVDRK